MNRGAFIRICACAVVALFGSPSIASAELTGRISPERPMLEQTRYGAALNFDVLVTNDTEQTVELSQLRIQTRSDAGTVLTERVLDGQGSAPNLLILPSHIVEPKQSRLFFNPFPLIDSRLPVSSIRVQATFQQKNGGSPIIQEYEAHLAEPRAARNTLVLPMKGCVKVHSGHDALAHHRRWDFTHPLLGDLGFKSNAMRYAYDFVGCDGEAAVVKGDAARNESWFGYGSAVRASDVGIVVSVVADQPDNRQFDPQSIRKDPNALFGNYVVIAHADGTYSLFGHLQQRSVAVRVNERVARGQVIAKVGASGSAEFPHLHYQLMSAPTMQGEGVPSYFERVDLLIESRQVHVPHGYLESGDILRAR
jgi:hypothetical protein